MRIRDLRSGMIGVTVEGTVVEKGEARRVSTSYGPAEVANATLRDSSGSITLSLWNDQIGEVGVGDKVRVVNGYVRGFRGRLYLNTGKRGKIEILERGGV